MNKTISLLLLTSLLACGGSDRVGDSGEGDHNELGTPSGPLPQGLVGGWFTGTLSSIQYYDRDTGAWQNPNGAGFYYIFREDGSYETGAVIDSTVGNCNIRLLGTEVGTMTYAGNELQVYRHWIKTHATNTCGNDGDREQGQAQNHLTYTLDTDDSGRPRLTLVDPVYGATQYRTWDLAQ